MVESIRTKQKEVRIRRILAIDGGGIKGVIPAAFLAQLEQTSGKRVTDCFDLIAGTSTGGIIALGLGLGLSAKEILSFYEDKGTAVFGQTPRWPASVRMLEKVWGRFWGDVKQYFVTKHSPEELFVALEEVFGARKLGDSRTRLVVPSFDSSRRTVHVFKTAHDQRFDSDWRLPAVDVALATAAAPTYLPAHHLENGLILLDGGVWANNPVAIATVEAIGVLGWRPEELRVLSLGCSEEVVDFPTSGGKIRHREAGIELLMHGQARGALGMAKLLLGDSSEQQRLYRIQESVPKGTFQMDDAKKIQALKGIGYSLAREHCREVEGIFLRTPCEAFVPDNPSRGVADVA